MTDAPADGVLAVFDIGGTWFRDGIYDAHHGVYDVVRQPAINYLTVPAEATKLQQLLVEHMAARVEHRRQERPIHRAGVSMGAALNAHDGYVYGSGPLWGPQGGSFDLLGALRRADPSTRWVVINDVTAALVRYVADTASEDYAKVLLITVSSGIGARLYDRRTRRIPTDPIYGLQGEIGHLPATTQLRTQTLVRECECGTGRHLNALSSGRGIDAILSGLADSYSAELSTSRLHPITGAHDVSARFGIFADALRQGDAFAADILAAVVSPLAEVLRVALTLDPEIDRIALMGGVVESLGTLYTEALIRAFTAEGGLYVIGSRDADYLRRRLRCVPADDSSGLIGAALVASNQLGVTS